MRAFRQNIFFCSLGCIVCFCLQQYFATPNYWACPLTGLAGSFLPISNFYNQKKAIAAVYCGSFAGMTSLAHLQEIEQLLLLSLLVGIAFHCLTSFFRGVGGKLGSIAFFSSQCFLFATRLF